MNHRSAWSRSLACFFTFRYRIDREVVSGETPRNWGTPSGKFVEFSSMTLQDIERLGHDEHIVRTIFNALQAA
jgi:hypothetical protein